MKFSRYTLFILFLLVVSALGALLVNQYRILKKDIETNRNIVEMAIPRVLSDLYDNMMYHQGLREHTDYFRGTTDFTFSSSVVPEDPLQLFLKAEIDRVLSTTYPGLEYQLDGFVSSEYGCMIHREHRPELPKALNVLDTASHMCFCMILGNTLDIAMSITNKEEAALGESAEILQTSFLLIVVILGAFGYTVYTINRQKKLSDLKRDFINNLTHEFKTPIFSISLAAKTLAEREEVKKSPSSSTYVELISAETRRLQTQVDKVLQMAMIDSGNLHFEKKTFDLHQAIRQVAESFAIVLNEKKGILSLELGAKKHLLTGDETHLKNMIYNLIDNAQKYCDKPPEIEITTADAAENGITVMVKDNGIGMDEQVQKYIFDPFYRASQGDVQQSKGFGLGLSYVKRIVEYHKGSISLRSLPGAGSEFTIFLPYVS